MKQLYWLVGVGRQQFHVYRIPPDYEDRKKRWQKEHSYKVPNGVTKQGNPSFKTILPPMRWNNYDGPRSEVQKVNRVYASVNPNMGTLVKVKPDETVGRIQGLPESCIIDNKNILTINDVDKTWYINLAKKYIEDYTGVCV